MANIIYNEGKYHILRQYFYGTPETFGPFYIGLGSGGIVWEEDASLAQISHREISGRTYERQLVTRDDTVTGWEQRGDTMVSPELVFSNTSYDCWEDIDFAFLCFSPHGTSGDMTLLSAVQFPHTLVIKPNKSLRLQFRFRASTLFTQIVEFQSGSSSVTATASILPVDSSVTFSLSSDISATATAILSAVVS